MENYSNTTSVFDVPVNYVLGRCTFGDIEDDDEPINPTLSVLNASYIVKERVGPWWKGACLRRIRHQIVLRDVCMHMQGGQLTAILGSSGSGKTSLLDVISSRTNGTVSGKVYYNNIECTKDVFQQYGTYVMQADRLLPSLTVRETLRYSALLRLPGNTSSFDIEQKVNKVILEMGLKSVADSKIGGTVVRGISGGEKRRVTIAIQLLQNPKVILLDEPTSGLDTFTARYLMSSLADLAHNQGKIVLLTIHQPRSDIFRMFNQVGIMAYGKLVYFGGSEQMLEYFDKLGYPCPTYSNPTDHYVDLASVDRRNQDSEEESSERVKELTNVYANSEMHKDVVYRIIEDTMKPTTGKQLLYQRYYQYRPQGSSFFRTLVTLLSRMSVQLFRDRSSYLSRIFLLSLFVPFICLFLGRLKNTQTGVQDRIGLMYQSSQVPPYVAILNAVALFPSLRDIYYRECGDGLYSATTFLIAYALHVLPFTILSSAIFSSVVYWVTGLTPATSNFLLYVALVFFLNYWGEMLCVVLFGAFLNPSLVNSTSAIIASASGLMASGFLKSLGSMIPIFKWMAWGNIFKYAGEILVANEFHNLQLTCHKNDSFCFPTGDAYMDIYYPDAYDNIRRNYWAMGGFTAATILLAMIIFKIRGVPNLH